MREKNDLHTDKTSNPSKPQDTVHTVCAWCFMLSGIFVVLCFFLKGTPRLLYDFSFYAAVVLGMGSIIVDRVNSFLKKSQHTKKEVNQLDKEFYHIANSDTDKCVEHSSKLFQKPPSIERVGHILQNIAFVCFVLSAPILVLFFLVSSKASAPSAFWGHLFYATLFIGIVGGHLGHFLINKKKNKHNDSADKESAGRES